MWVGKTDFTSEKSEIPIRIFGFGFGCKIWIGFSDIELGLHPNPNPHLKPDIFGFQPLEISDLFYFLRGKYLSQLRHYGLLYFTLKTHDFLGVGIIRSYILLNL